MSWLDNEHSLPVLWERIKKLIKLHADNKENPHGVTKAQVGLGSVDNTADKDKKVAEATKATQDGAGNVITDTYLKKTDSTGFTNTKVKGAAETEYHTGNVNITPANIGITVVNNTADQNKKVAEATKATQDGDGNVIADTYLKKTDAESGYTNTSVKGSAETTYRTGEVNITPANLGITVVNNTKDSVKKVAEATKATQDGAGNVITDTYLKKVDAPSSSGQEVYSEEITLKSSSWSSNTMTIAPSHVTATNTVIVNPPYGYEDAYSSAGIKAIEQGAKSLKLTCDTPPASDIKVIIITIT